MAERWEPARAWEWYHRRPWLTGCNFVPSSAINQLEMWQSESFDPERIDRELGWLEGLGMNSLRVFLHDLLWVGDSAGFLHRVERFLEIAERRGIGIMFVLFDSCWQPYPKPGRQPAPLPGVHNSQWLQAPGLKVLRNPGEWSRLEDYVHGVVSHFRDDARVQIWDVWNEPANVGTVVDEADRMTSPEKAELVLPLLRRAFQWVRAARPSQPLTSGIWQPSDWEEMGELPKFQLEASDLLSFHCYDGLDVVEPRCRKLQEWGRPLLCTEYLARSMGSTLEAILPYFQEEKIAAYNWGAVWGKTQTLYPWDSAEKPYPAPPQPWHHDLFHPDGEPYDRAEVALFRSLRGKAG